MPEPQTTSSTTPGRCDWLDRARADWTWRIRANWASLLEGDTSPDWLNLKEDPRATRVKVNDAREVWRVQIGQHLLFVKIARPPRRWARWRRILRGPDAERERQAAEYAARHHIDTVTPIACAYAPIQGRRPDSVLVTVGMPDAQPLDAFWRQLDPRASDTRRIKNAVIDDAARLLARAHQYGFLHADLHAGNLLIEPKADGQYRTLFVDLQSVRTGRSLTGTNVIRNLASFNQWFHVHGLLTDRIRFLNRYFDWRKREQTAAAISALPIPDRRQLLDKLEPAVRAHARALYAKRDRRCLRDDRYFAKLALPNHWRGHVFLASKHPMPGSRAATLTFTRKQWQDWLAVPEDWTGTNDRRRIIKDSGQAIICRADLNIENQTPLKVICKRPYASRLDRRVAYLFRTSRAMRNWKCGNALLHRGIPTARPLAVLDRRRCGLLRDSLLITEYVEHAHDLDTLLTVQLREMPLDRQYLIKRRLTESLAAALGRFHDTGFSHRDLKASNVIVQWDPQSSTPPRVLLIDLDGIRLSSSTSSRSVGRALQRLDLSLDHCRRVNRTDRARFLKRYLARTGKPTALWRTLWRTLDRT